MTGRFLPATATRVERAIAAAAIVSAVSMAVFAPPLLRGAISRRAARLPENAPFRALEALVSGDRPRLRAELDRVAADVPAAGDSGPILLRAGVLDVATSVPTLLEIGERATRAGFSTEARAAALAALRRLHLRRRAVEEADPWRILAANAPSESFRRETLAVLAVVSPAVLRREFQGDPLSAEADRRARAAGSAPVALLDGPAGRYPAVLPPITTTPDADAAETRDLELPPPGPTLWNRIPHPWYPPAGPKDEGRRLWGSGASATELTTAAPTGGVILFAEGRAILGVAPILLVSIDGGEPHPLLVDSPELRPYRLDLPLEAGRHRLVVEFLNDFRLGPAEDRGVVLGEIAVTPPSEATARRSR